MRACRPSYFSQPEEIPLDLTAWDRAQLAAIYARRAAAGMPLFRPDDKGRLLGKKARDVDAGQQPMT